MKSYSIIFFLLLLYGNTIISQSTPKYFFIRKNIAKLTYKLTEGLNEEESVLAIHEWITHNIKWKDKKTPKTIKKIVRKTLRNRKGPASNYVVLFDEMCQFAQVESKIVNGNVSPLFSAMYDSRAYEISRHSWNAVKISGKWNLIDVTFDAGHLEKKKYRLEKFIENNIAIPFPGGVKRIYFIKKKSKFIHNPTKDFYLKSEEMLKTHYPLMPMWQLTPDTLSAKIYRKQEWEISQHLNTTQGENSYDFEEKINKYIHTYHKDYNEGISGNNHNDTNFVKLSHGEMKLVDGTIFQFPENPVNNTSEIKERLEEIDTLFEVLNASKSHAKKASQIEKKVFSDNNKVHKNRNKLVIKENRKNNSKLDSYIEKTIELTRQFKDENKRIEKKFDQHNKKHEKYSKWSPSFKDVKPVSKKEYAKSLRLIKELYKEKPLIEVRMDSLEKEFTQQLEMDFTSLKKNIIDSCRKENSLVFRSKLIIEAYDHNLDSSYFSTRGLMNNTHGNHVILTDSLIKKFVRIQKQTLSNYKKELSAINALKKTAYEHIKLIYGNGGLEKEINELKKLNEVYLERLSTLLDFNKKVISRNEDFIGWFKVYRKELRITNANYLAETGKEKLRIRADLNFEKKQYNYHLQKIKDIQKEALVVKAKLKKEQKSFKELLKEYE